MHYIEHDLDWIKKTRSEVLLVTSAEPNSKILADMVAELCKEYAVHCDERAQLLSAAKERKGKKDLLDLINAPYAKYSETSKAAASNISVADWTKVLEYIKSRGLEGSTDYEIERDLGLRHQTASARRRGLQLKGLVVLTGNTRRTDTGRMAGVYLHSKFVHSIS